MKKCNYVSLNKGSWVECDKRATYDEIDAGDGKTRYPLCEGHALSSTYKIVPITDWNYGRG